MEWIQRPVSGLIDANRLSGFCRPVARFQRLEKVAALRVFQQVQMAEQLGHYIRRAREERVLAAQAASSEGELAHRQLARQYEILISELNASALTVTGPEPDEARFPPLGNGFANGMVGSFRPRGLPRIQH